MKKCPFCAEDIQEAAIICKHCQRDVTKASAANVVTKANTSRGLKIAIYSVLCFIAFFVLVVGVLDQVTTGPATRAARSQQTVPSEQLALLSARGHQSESGSYWYVEGEVENLSNDQLRNVTAVASWYANNGDFITSDTALIDYNPLMPGQKSPFKTMTRGNPLMSRFSIDFKTFGGRSISVRDDRKK